jgi:hypothetical protein
MGYDLAKRKRQIVIVQATIVEAASGSLIKITVLGTEQTGQR